MAITQENRIVSSEEQHEEKTLEVTLRPQRIEEYIGQEKVKENLKILMESAKIRKEPIDHILLYGPPGLGKTTLSHIVAHEMGAGLKTTSGPAIERAGDLAAILTNLEEGDILFIDEIHRIHRTIEEVLYPAMEDYHLDIIVGKGPSARTLKIDLPKFTLVGATTKISSLSAALRNRFGSTYHLNFYEDSAIKKIIIRAANILNIQTDVSAVGEMATRSRKTPRIANRLLKRVRDYAIVKGDGIITPDIAQSALEMLEVDHMGLDEVDRKILSCIIEKFNGGPVGLSTIAAATAEETQTVEEVYEPFLIQLGFLHRTPKGRVAMPMAYHHLNIPIPDINKNF